MNKKNFLYIFVILIVILIGVWFILDNKQGRSTLTQRSQNEKTTFKNVTSQQLYSMLASKDFFFVNVHIPYEGEVEKTDAFIPYDQIEANIGKLPKDKNAKIVLYCRSGRMSTIAAQKLADLGYSNVFNHLGGMIDWEKQGY
jgi:rhodanese-related sulfurtransferase